MLRSPSHEVASCGRQDKSRKWRSRQITLVANGCRRVRLLSAVNDDFKEFLLHTQDQIISEAEQLEAIPSKTFIRDAWSRGGDALNPGHGVTAVLEDGRLLEKAAVNTTIVSGTLSRERAQAMSARGRGIDPQGGQPYSAAALSLVFHSAHPFVPTLRADVRRFQVGDRAWYGGGCDLTPAYLFERDAAEFHSFWKALCDTHQAGLYGQLKEACDKYFFLPAWEEHRGIGGIFFDDMEQSDLDVARFVQDVAHGILPSWRGIADRRRHEAFTQQQREWQLQRRSMYLFFNLLYDRGVRFGLAGGRVESIFVSCPPLVQFNYRVEPAAGTPEAALLDVLRTPRSWAAP